MKTRDSGMPPESYWETFFNPTEILTTLGLHCATGPVVDIGAGYGTFTFAAARLTGQPVIALDIEPPLLEDLARKARAENLDQVRPILRDVMRDGTGLPDGYADVVLVFNLLHCEQPVDLLKEVWRTLGPGGRVGVLHWRCDIPTPRGPDLSIRPNPDQCAAWLREAGFIILGPRKMLPPYHFGLVGSKS
ncbi:MAG: class I SAM-dependent methyltransferase, partial [Pseudomonadota bacterium]|nr:class I SAM-dependent methyltransferase [Pseudomonadota bacterium]